MWDWILILSLLFAGLGLIIIEIIFVPGTTIVGLFGCAFAITAIFSGYKIFGSLTGHYIFSGTFAVFVLAIYLSFRSDAWTRFANKAIHSSKVNDGLIIEIKVGMEGKAVSDLKLVGKAELGKGIYEVTATNWVDSGTLLKVVRIQHNKIFVAPLNI